MKRCHQHPGGGIKVKFETHKGVAMRMSCFHRRRLRYRLAGLRVKEYRPAACFTRAAPSTSGRAKSNCLPRGGALSWARPTLHSTQTVTLYAPHPPPPALSGGLPLSLPPSPSLPRCILGVETVSSRQSPSACCCSRAES